MQKKKLNKQQLREKQKIEDKKFNRTLIISFSLLVVIVVLVFAFVTYRCDTRFIYHKWVWYGREIPREWACMNGDILQMHKTANVTYNAKLYNFCSQHCFNLMVKNFKKVTMIPDAYSGDSINKADALIGLKEKGKPELVYFRNSETLNQYYGFGK